jgi:NADPH:quinone reductase-like Zn-dependent oxidoreductase
MGQRSWTTGQPLELLELPDPSPGPLEARVRVAAIGVNPVDCKVREGGPIRFLMRVVGPPLPFVPGIDFAGTVDAVGAQVMGVRLGDRVVGGTDFSRGQRGSYAEAVTARADQLCVLPASVDFDSAAGLPVAGVTAWMSLMELGQLASKPASVPVLVLGASGGVGQFAVQVARMAGAKGIAVCSTRNVALVRALGADAVLDYTAGDALAQAKPLGPFAVVIDCVGEYSAAGCCALLMPGGRHILVAGAEHPRNMAHLMMHPVTSRTLLGRATTARLRPLVDGIAAGQIRVAIAERIPLAEAERAQALVRTSRTVGKIVLVP